MAPSTNPIRASNAIFNIPDPPIDRT